MLRLTGSEALAVRASRKLKNDELLLTGFAGTRLRMELDRVPLWRGSHVSVRQLVEDFARYVYLPRLKDTSVLVEAIRDGVGLLTWQKEGFAFADSFDESVAAPEAHRYRGLHGGQNISLFDTSSPGLLVRSEVAWAQIEAETAPPVAVDPPVGPSSTPPSYDWNPPPGQGPTPPPGSGPTPPPGPVQPKRFHGTVTLDPTRPGRDASRIAEEVIAHLSGLVGARVTITLEIDADVPNGVPENVVRTVTENERTLRFDSQGFEQE